MLITIIFKQNEPRSIQSLIWLVRRSQLCETISLIPDVKTSVFIFLPSHLLVMPFKCLATWYRTLGCWLARLTLLEGGAYWTARITGRNYHAVVRRFLIKKNLIPKLKRTKSWPPSENSQRARWVEILLIKRDDSLQRHWRGEAGMEAIRKILYSQASQLILVSPRGGGGWGGVGVFNLCGHA